MNPTLIVGLSATLFALVSCAVAWLKGKGTPRRGQLAAVLALLELALFLDMIFNLRWLLHDWIDREAMAHNDYGRRFGPQHLALIILAVAVASAIVWALHRYRVRPGATLAVCGAILSIGCWCAEVISLHAMDAIFHAEINGVMLVGLIWIACSLITSAGILLDASEFRDSALRSR